jgi:hypothetical protein
VFFIHSSILNIGFNHNLVVVHSGDFIAGFFQEIFMSTSHVFDTYAKTNQGKIIHFDVVINEQDQQKALDYAKQWLKSIGEENATVTSENCYFCHSVETPAELKQQISEHGYAIYKLEGCPK